MLILLDEDSGDKGRGLCGGEAALLQRLCKRRREAPALGLLHQRQDIFLLNTSLIREIERRMTNTDGSVQEENNEIIIKIRNKKQNETRRAKYALVAALDSVEETLKVLC